MKIYLSSLICLISVFAFAQQKVSLESLRELPQVGNPVISPEGTHLLYTVTKTLFEENKRQSTLYLLDLSSNDKTQLAVNVSDPKWVPDGTAISYKASYGGTYGIFKAKLNRKKKKAP